MLSANIDSLPDELVKEVLSDVLAVSEDEFSHVGPLSPFGRKVSSSSDALLVSKRWLRIGTPILHESIVLRSSAQADALYGFIRGNFGSQVKGYVRRIRLEGSFGAVVGKIFTVLPNISDLYLRLPSHRGENVNGLLQGLLRLNPIRLILEVPRNDLRKNSFTMITAITHAVKHWTSLSTFSFYCDVCIAHVHEEDLIGIYESLSTAPCLDQAILTFAGTGTRQMTSFIKTIGRNTSLKAIRVYVDQSYEANDISDGLSGHPCAGIVHCISSIIEERYADSSSKKIALRLALRFVALCPPSSPGPLFRKLSEDDKFPMLVDIVRIARPFSHSRRSLPPSWGVTDKCTVKRIMSSLRNIRYLSLSTEYASILDSMSEEAKLGLRGLHIDLTCGVVKQIIITQFRNLTTLILWVKTCDVNIETVDFLSRPSFVNLITLKIIDDLGRMNAIAINMLRACDFPSVETIHFTLSNDKNILVSDLECNNLPSFPKVQTIFFKGIPKGAYARLLSARFCPLQKLVFHLERTNLQRENECIAAMFDSIDFCNLTALSELQITSVVEWPFLEQELKNSAWNKRAQALTDNFGFKITDAFGTPWKPRLMKRANKKPRDSRAK
ncbi:hypothetical protein ACEPAI_7202 [Sanghuangporus weigelae]